MAQVDAFRVLDVRDEAAFRANRLTAAVRVPIERWEAAAKDPATSLQSVTFWRSEIERLGIATDCEVVVYDDGRMTEAARVWYILQHFGVPARVINRGWPAVRDTFARQVGSGEPPRIEPGRFDICLDVTSVAHMDRDQVKALLGTSLRILDARTDAEFDGRDLRKNARGGHLPAAVKLSHTKLLDEQGLLRPAAELREQLEKAGFQRGDRIVTHCDGGGRAALAGIAAVRAGFADVRTYYLSFADWAKDASCPVVQD